MDNKLFLFSYQLLRIDLIIYLNEHNVYVINSEWIEKLKII